MRYFEILNEYIDIEKTLKNYGEKIIKKLENEKLKNELSPQNVVEMLIETDPTKNVGNYFFWLLNMYLKGEFGLSDLKELEELLKLFHKLKHKLPVEKRDINKIKSIDELRKIYNDLKSEKTSREEKRETKREITEKETKIVYDGKKGKIIVPLSFRSSCFWGLKTKWCTTSRKTGQEYFDHYYSKGNLYVFITPSGKKYQLHFESKEFVDNTNQPIEINEANSMFYDELIDLLDILVENIISSNDSKEKKSLISFLVSDKYDYLGKRYFSKIFSEEEIVNSLKKSPLHPKILANFEHLGSEFVKKAVEVQPDIIAYLENVYDREVYDKVLKKNVYYINSIPYRVLKKIPKETIEYLIKKYPKIIDFLGDVKEKLSKDFYREMLEKDHEIISLIPSKYDDLREKFLLKNPSYAPLLLDPLNYSRNNVELVKKLIQKYPETFKKYFEDVF